MSKQPTQKQIKRYHMCNCEHCRMNTPCEICGSTKELHRSHIIPQRIVNMLPENKDIWDKERWKSYEDLNVILLCKGCHKRFDLFKLNNRELDLIRDVLVEVQGEFVEIFRKFNEIIEIEIKTFRRFELWVEKQNYWLMNIK